MKLECDIMYIKYNLLKLRYFNTLNYSKWDNFNDKVIDIACLHKTKNNALFHCQNLNNCNIAMSALVVFRVFLGLFKI